MNFAVLDFETTGNLPTDEIIQVGLVRIEEGEIRDRFHSLVKTERDIPPFIERLTGISKDETDRAPELEEVIPQMLPLLEDCVLVAHNAGFDLGYLQRALDQCGYAPFDGPVLDLLDLLKICYPGLSSYQLSLVCDALGVDHERPHQADSDALAAAQLLLKCLDKLSSLPLITLQRLTQLFEPFPDGLSFLLTRLVREKQYSGEDAESARVYRQLALAVDDWRDEQPAERSESLPLSDSFDDFAEQLREKMRHDLEGRFEEREAQTVMMGEVFDAIASGRHLLIEAGTGTGKSLAYLIPALYYAVNTEQKVVVSTHTINLQEQLRERDIPLLKRIFPVPFRAAVLKGRNHYLCLRKFENKINLQDFENRKEERLYAAQMIVWLGMTESGDEEGINLGRQGKTFWQSVASDAESCMNRACPWFRKCFYHRARHQAQIADLIITNHSMLFTDVIAEHRLLPAYDYLIVDEAHHFEEVAEQHLGTHIHYHDVARTLIALRKDAMSGLLPHLSRHIKESGLTSAEEWSGVIDEQAERLVELKQQWDELAGALYEILETQGGAMDGGVMTLRLKPPLTEKWQPIYIMEENFYTLSGDIIRQLNKMMNAVREDANEDSELESQLTDLNGALSELAAQRDALRYVLHTEDEEIVRWLEASSTYRVKSIQLTALPVDVSPLLQQYFFDAKESVVMTSATLTVDRSFEYVIRQLGLVSYESADRLKALSLPSPFDYRKQALVCIPRDFPKLGSAAGEEEFVDKLSQSLAEIAISTGGRMLALFTSYRMLKEVYERLKDELKAKGSDIEVLGQGMEGGTRNKLTRRFVQNPASVLLGTSSFWEGVDIPGDTLSCLAIVRLPFKPPNHPVVEAKCEKLREQNENPFMKYSVPQAVIRFKQGFGRLVRTAGDRGIAVVYDTRIIETKYGKNFLYSLPGPKIEHMPTEQLVPRIQEWLQKPLSESARKE